MAEPSSELSDPTKQGLDGGLIQLSPDVNKQVTQPISLMAHTPVMDTHSLNTINLIELDSISDSILGSTEKRSSVESLGLVGSDTEKHEGSPAPTGIPLLMNSEAMNDVPDSIKRKRVRLSSSASSAAVAAAAGMSMNPDGTPLVKQMMTFKCEAPGCNKAYSSASHLKRHQRVHSQEKPYICERCKSAFFLAHHLRYHERTHTGEKPYVCSHENCGKSYSQPGDYYRHMRKHTGLTPYNCLECGKTFIRGRDLENHRRKAHAPAS